MINNYSLLELIGMLTGGMAIITGLLGLVLSHFTIKPADRLFTGKTHPNRVWYPLCYWGMGEYAIALMGFKSSKTREKYPLYFKEWKSGSWRSRWVTILLLTIYIPSFVCFTIAVIAYWLKELIS
ncbi:hypothetical protein [Larsenimonas suaedae]|uniref:Uncharacterized protein n=1 Tax=Larsenimonas suaedae TaxID=1851019 RepID=A0ABU1GWB6_9GAMM|nr:hypothetical protein [Larsenimonas suaedae]MCM2973454.1 hypothetical protein [Larsenimonas suaedae]MDR5896348.1 hypothetical protein [Larsenimonas suaedae]